MMSERLHNNELSAVEFAELHVYAPENYQDYFDKALNQWREKATEALNRGERVKPMWLRRNGEAPNEFAAHVDYAVPSSDDIIYLAAIDIDGQGGNTEVEVWFPDEDGSGQPTVVTRESYDMESLARAIDLVESSVQPASNI